MIKLEKVSKKFGTGVFVLSQVNILVNKGEFVFLTGPTGAGKTTIFRLITREILPTEGQVMVDNWDVVKLARHKIPHLRKKVGVVFQDLKILMDRTIFENIILPLEVAGVKEKEAGQKAEALLEKVGIINHRDQFPIQLSGGELQRTAIAKALNLSPLIVLADEPTGNLDTETAFGIVDLLENINKQGTTVIMATHNTEIVGKASKRVITLHKGRLVKDETPNKKEEKKG
jgi:cell division transport system ATP-binding protein